MEEVLTQSPSQTIERCSQLFRETDIGRLVPVQSNYWTLVNSQYTQLRFPTHLIYLLQYSTVL
jgi:hypothetical protein